MPLSINYPSIKCCIVGSCGVGKTTIIKKYLSKTTQNTETTLGAIFWSLDYTSECGKTFKLDFWDTAGQERYNSLIPMYSRNSDIIIIAFDLTDKSSFLELDKWLDTVSQYNHTCEYILIGNKTDKSFFRQITERDIDDFIDKHKKYHIIYLETSALNGDNIPALFDTIYKIGLQKNKSPAKTKRIKLDTKNKNTAVKTEYKCCPIL